MTSGRSKTRPLLSHAREVDHAELDLDLCRDYNLQGSVLPHRDLHSHIRYPTLRRTHPVYHFNPMSHSREPMRCSLRDTSVIATPEAGKMVPIVSPWALSSPLVLSSGSVRLLFCSQRSCQPPIFSAEPDGLFCVGYPMGFLTLLAWNAGNPSVRHPALPGVSGPSNSPNLYGGVYNPFHPWHSSHHEAARPPS